MTVKILDNNTTCQQAHKKITSTYAKALANYRRMTTSGAYIAS